MKGHEIEAAAAVEQIKAAAGVERWRRWGSDLLAGCVCQDAPLDIILASHS